MNRASKKKLATISCHWCHTRRTSLWRRYRKEITVCNACALRQKRRDRKRRCIGLLWLATMLKLRVIDADDDENMRCAVVVIFFVFFFFRI